MSTAAMRAAFKVFCDLGARTIPAKPLVLENADKNRSPAQALLLRAQIREMYLKERMKRCRIAAELGVSGLTVYRHLKGVKR